MLRVDGKGMRGEAGRPFRLVHKSRQKTIVEVIEVG